MYHERTTVRLKVYQDRCPCCPYGSCASESCNFTRTSLDFELMGFGMSQALSCPTLSHPVLDSTPNVFNSSCLYSSKISPTYQYHSHTQCKNANGWVGISSSACVVVLHMLFVLHVLLPTRAAITDMCSYYQHNSHELLPTYPIRTSGRLEGCQTAS